MTMSLLAFGCHDKTVIQMYSAHSLDILIGRWILLPYPVLARKLIHLIHPLQAQPLHSSVHEVFLWPRFEPRPGIYKSQRETGTIDDSTFHPKSLNYS